MFKKAKFLLLFVLSAHASIVQLCDSPRIFMLHGFLSDYECDYMIQLASPHLIASKVIDEKNKGEAIDSRRTSRGYFLPYYCNDAIVKGIEQRIAALTQIPIENGENLHVLYYPVRAEYQPHHDYFNAATPGGADVLRRGGQRVASLIMYLNTPIAGGETVFPKANISITPKKGDAVLFYNCTPNGVIDPMSLHGGAPVIAGEKWIMTKWLRERAFK